MRWIKRDEWKIYKNLNKLNSIYWNLKNRYDNKTCFRDLQINNACEPNRY